LVLGLHALGARVAAAELRRLLALVGVLGVVLVVVPAQGWLRAAIDRLVFRRSRRRWEELHAFLHTLSPELGVPECGRRALAEVTRAMQLRGAALVLASGEAVTHGAFAFAPLATAWPRWAGALPPHTIGKSRFRDLPLPLIEALLEADVVAIVPVVSPRRLWGHVLVRTDLLRASFSDDDDRAIDAVADQLGLGLDAAELLARTVAVERSLAHAEKLAAIGELAARIAHEIRNPVTAARSLAQQLAREPDSPFAVEHRLILGELERVERQVAALLRFARREDLRFEPVDLGELARATLEAFRPRLEASGVTLELELADGVAARADREKLRQVLINLLENALDAMTAEAGGPRTLSVAVGNGHGAAALEVRDSGPGVPAEVLPHLGEPFFSTKPSGTGLGLAMARDLTLLATLAVGRHAIRLMPVPERPPTRAWLAANYGPPASAGLGLTLARVLLGPAGAPGETFGRFCGLTFGVLCLREGWKTARPGAWGPEGAVENRRPDVALVAGGLLVSAVAF